MLAAQCKGVTDYQLPISTALREFEKVRGQGRGNQHILFLTDGLPTAGDRNLVREMELARRLGCCIHTVFIGMQTFPAILERMSQKTGGTQFQAFHDHRAGKIEIVQRRGDEWR